MDCKIGGKKKQSKYKSAYSTAHSYFKNKQNKSNATKESDLAQIFEKKFQYKKQSDSVWELPEPTELFKEYYQLEALQGLKQRLNTVKCKLNNYGIEDWSAHTRRRDPAGEIQWRLKNETKAEFVTVAWCKFFECLHKFPLVQTPVLNSLHLCEAPGAFIAALNHYLYSKFDSEKVHWNWLSTSLNPYYEGNPLNEMIVDDRFMLNTLENWLFQKDFTGNIISRKNIEHMAAECTGRLEGNVQLITADGSIDCMKAPDSQEEVVSPLHFAELVAALLILAEGGNYVMKMFTAFEATTVCKLYLLNCIFEEVHIFKPATSKQGNSEMYVICLGYKKRAKYLPETLELMKAKLAGNTSEILPMFGKMQIPADFLVQHEICTRFFMNLQVQAIESNIYAYEKKPPHDTQRCHKLRSIVRQEFYKRYNVQPLPKELTILHQREDGTYLFINSFIYKGSHTDRELLKGTSLQEQVYALLSNLNELERSLCTRFGVLLDEDTTEAVAPPLQVYKGAPYATLQSSLFCTAYILVLRQKLMQMFVNAPEPIWQTQPICQLDKGIEFPLGNITDNEDLSDFMRFQQRQFVELMQHIITHTPHRICFKNMPFITHYAVSILRLLALRVFDHICISNEPAFTVTLEMAESKTYDEPLLKELTSLCELLAKDINVLCVIDIRQLHRNQFCQALMEYNNLLLLKNFRQTLNN